MTPSSARKVSRRGKRDARAVQHPRLKMLALLVLCMIPGYGALRLVPQGGLPVVALWYFGVSLLTFILYRHDKMRAGDGGWRIPENWLHAAELLGGWPGALLAQQLYRHKTRKVSFQVVFWVIVLAHQAAWVVGLRAA
jgi:uncharacterized membrane protein YsdA (DUF1294 family)